MKSRSMRARSVVSDALPFAGGWAVVLLAGAAVLCTPSLPNTVDILEVGARRLADHPADPPADPPAEPPADAPAEVIPEGTPQSADTLADLAEPDLSKLPEIKVPVPCLSVPMAGSLITPCGEVEIKDEPTHFTTPFGNFTAPGKAKFQKFIAREKMAFSEYTGGFVAAAAGLYATVTLAVSSKRNALIKSVKDTFSGKEKYALIKTTNMP